MKILVIGAGIGGLSAAIALRRAGHDVEVFERRGTVEDLRLGGGLHLWTNAMRALQRLGLVEAALDHGTILEGMEFITERGALLGRWDSAPLRERTGLPEVGITRAHLHGGVLGAAANISTIRFGWRCTRFVDDGDGVRLTFDNGQEVRGDVLVGADGIYSTVRSQLLGASAPRYAGYTQWQAVVRLDHGVEDSGTDRVIFGRAQRAVYHPVKDRELFWAAVLYGPPVAANDGEGRKQTLMSRFREWPRTVPQLIEATEEPSITWAAVHDRTPAQRWGVGRITLIGDAAHPMTTNLSQGGCLALEDGVVLAESLTEHANDVVAGLRAYEARRIRRTSPIVLRSRRIALAGGLRSKATCGVRNLFFRVALNGVGLRQHRQEMLAPW